MASCMAVEAIELFLKEPIHPVSHNKCFNFSCDFHSSGGVLLKGSTRECNLPLTLTLMTSRVMRMGSVYTQVSSP
jgi:hypothetical protein